MTELTETAESILKKRYYLKDALGNLLETKWGDVTVRNAECFGATKNEADTFKSMMDALDFLPNSPAIMNAGTEIRAYSACFVLPLEDTIDSIYKFYGDAAKISKSGGGIGANYSKLRAEGSNVGSTGGVASGPISFATVQDVSTEIIKQGGKRRGANMGILNVDHEDIEQFISVKDTPGVLENFNLSVGITDEFMQNKIAGKNKALWDELTQRAWSSGEPGVVFLDTMERDNPTPQLGVLDSTNPCGEQPLLPYENCCLGSINLANMITPEGIIDWVKLDEIVCNAVLFLNRVLDASELPIPECQEAMNKTRKIGLGIMGLHDMLIQLKLPYDSKAGRNTAAEVMEFIYVNADKASETLAEQEGAYGCWEDNDMPYRRNACLTTIAPTGTLSTIGDCSSGCEPYYAAKYTRNNIGTEFTMYNKWVTIFAERENCTEEEILVKYADLFKGAEDISWENHIKMQGVLQEWVDSSISKTINMPNDAVVEDVKAAYELAYKLGCKGITIYRDGSRDAQVLSTGTTATQKETPEESRECFKRDLPDTLSATRYRVKVNDQKAYIIICEDEGYPVEVFVKFPYGRDSNWDALCRSISLSLRWGIPLEDVIKQLERSVKVINDTPSQLARILKTYQSTKGIKVTNPCPECGSELIFTEGCEKCRSCSWSKCG